MCMQNKMLLGSMWRHDGRYVFLDGVLASIEYSPELGEAAFHLWHDIERIVHKPSLVPQFQEAGFRLTTYKHFAPSEPGHYHIPISHCSGKVCVYGASFIPAEQDAYSVLSSSFDLAYERSEKWIKHCTDHSKHGSPEIV